MTTLTVLLILFGLLAAGGLIGGGIVLAAMRTRVEVAERRTAGLLDEIQSARFADWSQVGQILDKALAQHGQPVLWPAQRLHVDYGGVTLFDGAGYVQGPDRVYPMER